MFGAEHAILEALKTRFGRLVCALLLTTVGVFAAILFLPQATDVRLLSAEHAYVMARVIDSRVSNSAEVGKTFDIRYSFALNGQTYQKTERGPLARNELWDVLPESEWDEAKRTGEIRVAYYPPSPGINVLARNLPHLWRDLYLGIGLTVIFLGGGVLWLSIMTIRFGMRLASDRRDPSQRANDIF